MINAGSDPSFGNGCWGSLEARFWFKTVVWCWRKGLWNMDAYYCYSSAVWVRVCMRETDNDDYESVNNMRGDWQPRWFCLWWSVLGGEIVLRASQSGASPTFGQWEVEVHCNRVSWGRCGLTGEDDTAWLEQPANCWFVVSHCSK